MLVLAVGCSGNDGDDGKPGQQGPAGPGGPPGDTDPTTAVEACVGCHGPTGVIPVAMIQDPFDAHFVDTDPMGPQSIAGYRRLDVTITSVDVTGSSVVIEFDVADENMDPVDTLLAADGRFTIARLQAGAGVGDASTWTSLITRTENPGGVGDGPGTPATQANSEGFSSGLFEDLTGGSYRYTSSYDPSSDIMDGDTMRVAIQISASDLPSGNGWCNFDADTSSANDCVSPVSLTRDIVETTTCNGCHGVTPDVKLALHGGGRTQVEYCVTCHNPGTTDSNSGNVVDFKMMIHKIHYGSSLANGYRIWGFRNTLHDYSTVSFTKDIDDCVVCHQGGGAQVDNWKDVPTREACGSCHDDVNFDTGANHGTGGVQVDNTNCSFCHPADGMLLPPGQLPIPVAAAHLGAARRIEGATYRGVGNGFSIDAMSYNPSGRKLTVDFSVRRGGGVPMILESDPEWTASGGASRLALVVGWNTDDYTNEGSGSTPALPISVNALNVGGAVTALGGGLYRTVVTLPSSATSGSVTAALEGHPAADLDGDLTYSDRIAVRGAFMSFDVVQRRTMTVARRDVVDVANCNKCHDSAGAGISLHGNNRTSEVQLCVLCHNADATDINRRPAPPAMTVDGKDEESIHFRRLIHRIHSGAELEEGIVVYGFGGRANDFSTVEFIGNRMNCETCHLPDTYSVEDALLAHPSTIDTGADLADPDDDLNISRTAAVCSGCHDDQVAIDHMELNGAAFAALDADILDQRTVYASSSTPLVTSQPLLGQALLPLFDAQALDGAVLEDSVEAADAAQTLALLPAHSDVIDMASCQGCHDAIGSPASLHDDQRSPTDPVCGVCHEDLGAGTLDAEEAFVRTIHTLHADDGSATDCATCHLPGTADSGGVAAGIAIDDAG